MKQQLEQMIKTAALLTLLALLPLAACAPGSSMDRHRRQGPPQAAIDACKGKQAGDQVQFETRRGTLQGTCQERDGQLVAVPEGHRGGRAAG